MKPRTKKILLRIAAVFAILLLLLIIAFAVFRNQILAQTIDQVSAKMQTDYQSDLTVKNAKFSGVTEVSMAEVVLVPQNGDTLISINQLTADINFWQLFTGDVQLSKLRLNDGYVHAIDNENGKNFAAFIKPQQRRNASTNEKPNIARRIYRLLNTALNLVPTDINVHNVSLILNRNGKITSLDLDELTLVDEQLTSLMRIETGNFSQNWKISGTANPRTKQGDIQFFNRDSGQIKVPYLDEKYNLLSSFDSIKMRITDISMHRDELHIDGFTSIKNLLVNHPRLASKDVTIEQAEFDFEIRVGANSIVLDSTSRARMNKIVFHPYLSYNVEKDTVYQLKLNVPKMQAQDFIVSLPSGLFTNLDGMQAEGNFDFNLNFEYNKQHVNDLIFETSLNSQNVKILKYGHANLAKLNGPFTYRAIENGKPQRALLVSNENSNFTPLNQISPYLRHAVLTSEDPSFFSHKGFINEAFKQSIIKNIKTKKFTRGASTITMQLVKNVFLTREKTLSRKLEEIVLVYLLESNRIVSKDRMFEVYLNVIEWGPNVFGIGEAANFYFQKHPSALSLNESIFLAGIVPRPKAFSWQFSNDGSLKPYAIQKTQYISNLMMRRGLIPISDTIAQKEPIYLSGRARSSVVTAPEINAQDTLNLDLFDEFDF